MSTPIIKGTFAPERMLEHYKYLHAYLPVGEKNKISKEDLYKKYKTALENFDEDYKNGKKKLVSEVTFQRITRKLCEEARQAGWKVLYSTEKNNSGIWICKDDDEYNEFKNMQVRKITKGLQELANLEQKNLKVLIGELFLSQKKRESTLQHNSLFEGANA